MWWRRTASVAVAVAVAAGATAAGTAPLRAEESRAHVFRPQPVSEPIYDAPDPLDMTHTSSWVDGPDGTQLFVETVLPVAKPGGPQPPERLPVVLNMTPYAGNFRRPPLTLIAGPDRRFVESFVRRGYAFAVGHVYGSGNSGGCFRNGDPTEIEASVRVLEHVAAAPWSDGNVGMVGGSHDALEQVGVAGWHEQDRVSALKAIAPAAAPTGWYDQFGGLDGVPFRGNALANTGQASILPVAPRDAGPGTSGLLASRTGCQGENMTAAVTAQRHAVSTPYTRARELRVGAGRVRAAVLMFQGFTDEFVYPSAPLGFFDRLQPSTPRALVLGQWGHNDFDAFRGDVDDMVVAWMDRWVRGLPSGAEAWPTVQIQATTGAWRTEPSWPSTAHSGQLALSASPDGPGLGATQPSGSTTFSEDGPGVQFTTDALASPLHITGVPVLDLAVSSTTSAGHVGVRLEALGPDGSPLPRRTLDFGARSLAFRQPVVEGSFAQTAPDQVVPGEIYRLPVALQPTDLVVPAGGRLRLTVAGSVATPDLPTPTSGTGAVLTLHHDCNGLASVLRFALPSPGNRSLEVRPPERLLPLLDSGTSDATQPSATDADPAPAQALVCGRAPEDPLRLLGR